MYDRDLKVWVWRRGRGVQVWDFKYKHTGNAYWHSSPGWYHDSKRGRMYRLTIDHDYPQRPVWLGYVKSGRRWVSVESLYEVMFVVHELFFIANRSILKKTNRSRHRRWVSKDNLKRLSKEHLGLYERNKRESRHRTV